MIQICCVNHIYNLLWDNFPLQVEVDLQNVWLMSSIFWLQTEYFEILFSKIWWFNISIIYWLNPKAFLSVLTCLITYIFTHNLAAISLSPLRGNVHRFHNDLACPTEWVNGMESNFQSACIHDWYVQLYTCQGPQNVFFSFFFSFSILLGGI